METQESVVQVDAGARTDAIRTKIEQMKQIGYALVGPMPDLPAGDRVPTAMKLVFRNQTHTTVSGITVNALHGEALLHSGPGEIKIPGADLDI